jgi:dephospho-CoA kinase
VLLAFSKDSLMERVVAKTGLKPYTKQTITNRAKLKAELKKNQKKRLRPELRRAGLFGCRYRSSGFQRRRRYRLLAFHQWPH